MKWIKSILPKHQVRDTLHDYITDAVNPEELKIEAVRTDEDGQSQRDLQVVLTPHSIRHNITNSYTSRYMG